MCAPHYDCLIIDKTKKWPVCCYIAIYSNYYYYYELVINKGWRQLSYANIQWNEWKNIQQNVLVHEKDGRKFNKYYLVLMAMHNVYLVMG